MNENETKIGIVIGLVLMVSQGYFIPLGYQELKNAQESPKWSTTDGIIISSGIKESKDEDSTTYEANVRYEYTIGEKRYSSNQVSFGQYGSSDPEHTQSIVRRYKKGQKVNVYVNPAHPDKSVLEPGATWSSYLPLGTSAIFVGMGAIIAIFSGIVAPRLRRRRTEALRQAASTLGLTFLDEAIMLENEAFYEFPLFQRGYSREISNILCKDNATGKTLFLFDYEFYEGGGENSRQHHQTVAAFYLPNRNLPEFSLRPENLFDKIGEFFGGQDIDFKSYPEFSESYRLQGCLESAIRKVFNFKVLQFFSQNPDWWLEGGGEWLVIYQLNRQVESKELDFFLYQITKISRLFSQ